MDGAPFRRLEGKWEAVIHSSFGRMKEKDRLAIACNLTAVDLGVKPAFLWDVTVVEDADVLRNFLRKAYLDGLTHNMLKNELLRGAHFVLKSEHDLHIFPTVPDLRVVSVAGDPELLSQDDHGTLRTCPCLDWGAALGFPVAYSTSPDDPGPVLAGVELLVVEVVVARFQSRKVNVVITSFSYPCQFEPALRDVIKKWIGNVRSRSSGVRNSGLDAFVRTRRVKLDGGLVL